jgi:hypothetical protein
VVKAKHAAQCFERAHVIRLFGLGDRDARSLGTADLLALLEPIWTMKPETASRVRQRIEAVLDCATAVEARDPAR